MVEPKRTSAPQDLKKEKPRTVSRQGSIKDMIHQRRVEKKVDSSDIPVEVFVSESTKRHFGL